MTTQAQSPSHRGGRRSSINDIARLAGVSRQTVSNVINNNSGYTEATKDRVVAAIEALGYRPNHAARTLRSRRTMQVAYHVLDQHLEGRNPFMVGFLQALVRAAREDRYHVLAFTTGDDVLGDYRDLIAMHSADGFILSDSGVDDPRAHLLAEQGVPFAAFGRTADDLPQSWVDVDNASGTAAMVDHLVSRGHRRIGYVGYDNHRYWNVERLDGYRAGLAKNGIRSSQKLVVEVSAERVSTAIRKLLTREGRPTAIMTGSDTLAAVAVGVAQSLSLKVGHGPDHDIAIAGFDGGLLQQIVQPTLTTVRIPVDKIAKELMSRFFSELRSGPTSAPGILVTTEIAEGETA